MSKVPWNPGPWWSARTAAAMRGTYAGSAMSAGSSVRPSRKPTTRTLSSGSAATTGAPTPASNAALVLCRSLSRSMASRLDSLELIRTT